ncbi:Microtubule-associated protein, microtubule dynamics during spindle orientation [Actinomortierella ambigua]|uniref:Microtubule-associated protein, microtubule dynamics during spindle orientation n=1 Tax=Actinomortierella ambigua TaxID=1343610 RepID=A0A9P6QHC9_9FUNG|nr:Microtubule-associated protein, microtubule dynamics during spindle orientation [Actinomortierella ambigua]
MDEYPTGGAQDDNFDSLPIHDRLDHKNWKARVSAYEQLAKVFRTAVDDSEYRQYEGSLKKMALDSNAVAQESALTTIMQFVDNAPEASRSMSSVVPAVVEKCLSAARTGTKTKAVELILLYVEVDTPDPIIENVIPGLDAKLPKLVAATTNALTAIVRTYGTKNINIKPVVKVLPKLFGHSDKNVRAEATALTIEIYRWIGKAISPFLEDLKPVQQKELNEAFEKLPGGKATPERIIRSQRAAVEAEAAAADEDGDEGDGGDGDADEEEAEPVDMRDLVDPVDVNAKMEGNFYDMLASKKWQERKEALDNLLPICKSIKIADSGYSQLVEALGKRMADTNINIVIVAANCLEGLALGMREDFNRYKSSVVGLIMDRLKERKVNVIEALSGALNALYSTIPFSELLEDTTANLAHKNPQIRAEVVKLQVYRLKNIKVAPSKAEVKACCEKLMKTFDDGDANVREATAEALGTLMKCCTEKLVTLFLEKLDSVKMTKVKEYCEKAEVKAKPAPVAPPPKPAPAKAAPAARAPAKKAAPAAEAAEPPKRKAPALSSAKKPAAAAASAAGKPAAAAATKKPVAAAAAVKAAPAAAAAAASKAKDNEPLRYKFSSEDAAERAAEFLGSDLIAEFGDSAWKVRLAAMERLYEMVDENPDFESELIIRVLANKPGWKESNFQVSAKMYATFQLLAEKSSTFSKACAALTVPAMVDKMGDIKLKKPAGECLTAYAEALSLSFVLSQSYDPLKKLKAPKALADSLVWVNQQLEDFGIAGMQVRELIDFLKFALGSANAAVRTNAISCLGMLRRFIGPSIRSFVEDCNSSLLSSIDAEFAKVADMAPPQVTKGSAPSEEAAGGGGGGAAAGGGGADAAMEELFPRVDISPQLTSALLEECGDANWKVRKEGLDKIAGILEANKRIKPNLGGLPAALKLRLADSNKNLQIQTNEICASLATAMGKPFERYAKALCSNVASCLTDQKDAVRRSSINALEAFATQCGMDCLVGSLATSLVTNSPALRKDMLTWLVKHVAAEKEKGSTLPDLAALVPPLFQCLQDRSADVRKASQAFLPLVIASVGYDGVVAKTNDLKGAAKSTVMPIIEAAKPPPPPRPPAAPTAPKAPVLPSLPRLGAKPGARPAGAAATGTASKLTRPVTPTIPSPTLQAASVATVAPVMDAQSTLSSLGGSSGGLIAPKSRLNVNIKKPIQGGGGGMSFMDSGMQSSSRMGPSSMDDDEEDMMTSRSNNFGMQQSRSMDRHQHQQQGMEDVVVPSAQIKRLSVSGTGSSKEINMDLIVTQITSDDPPASIDALKQLERALQKSPEVIYSHLNELVNALTLQVRLTFMGLEQQRGSSTTRVCKHLVNSLVSIFSNKDMAGRVDQDPLYSLLQELASRMLDKNLDRVESGQQLAKALNVTMVKVLENSHRNATFGALLLILVRCAQPLRTMTEDAANQAKFGDLIMKCIWKLTKTIKECVRNGTLRPNGLLADLNDFLVAIPPPDWKRRAQEGIPLGDMPLRTVKTVLVELSSGMGDDVFNHMELIDDPAKSAIQQYLVHMTGSKKRPISQVVNPASQPMPGNGGRDRLSVMGSPQQPLSPRFSQYQPGHPGMLSPRSAHMSAMGVNMGGGGGGPSAPSPPLGMGGADVRMSMSMPSAGGLSGYGHLGGLGGGGGGSGGFGYGAGAPGPPMGSGFSMPPTSVGSSFGQFSHSHGHGHIPAMAPVAPSPSLMQSSLGMPTSSPASSALSATATTTATTTAAAAVSSPASSGPEGGVGPGSSRSGSPSEAELNGRLTDIFTKIGTREDTKQGIQDLYFFQKMYPEMQSKVNAQLAKTGTFFQSYIRRGLANLDAEAAMATTGAGGVGSAAPGAGAPAGTGSTTGGTMGSTGASATTGPGGIQASSSGVGGGMGGLGSPMTRHRELLDAAAARRRESMAVSSESTGTNGTTASSGDPADTYKDRLARLQQMFGYARSSPEHRASTLMTTSPMAGGSLASGVFGSNAGGAGTTPTSGGGATPATTAAAAATGGGGASGSAGGFSSRQQQELEMQQHQLQQQQILSQHARSRPVSMYSQFGGASGAHHHNGMGMGGGGGVSGGSVDLGNVSMMNQQQLQQQQLEFELQQQQEREHAAARERAQTVAVMKERLARMKSQTQTSSQAALQQFHQQQAQQHGRGQSQYF